MKGQQFSLVVTSDAPAPLSDSESSIHQYPVKYVTLNNDASCLKPCVVNQQNGRWGAYLCANGDHIWLVSFETEEEAALVVQKSASIEFCDVDSNTPQFQSHSTTDEVISMTMDSSYGSMFPNFWRAQVQEKPDSPALRTFPKGSHTIKHFPRISEDEGVNEDVDVTFFDMSMKLWKFRYCYRSRANQNYGFTRGWSGFLKEMCLKPKDMVIFSAYEHSDGLDEVGKLYVTHVI